VEAHRDQVACPRSLKPPAKTGEGLRIAPQCDYQHRDLCFFPLLEKSSGQEEGADFNIRAFNYSVSLPRLVTEPLSLNTYFFFFFKARQVLQTCFGKSHVPV